MLEMQRKTANSVNTGLDRCGRFRAERLVGKVRLGLSTALMCAMAWAANAEPGEFVNGVLQPLADGFPNRPITLISNDSAGSADGIMTRQLQAALEKISPVPVLVSDEPRANGGTFDKLKELEGRDGGNEGYYPVAINVYGAVTDTLVTDIKGTLGMTVEDLNIVTVLEGSTIIVVQRKDAPWGKTFADLVKYAKENPGKIKYVSSTVGTGNDIAFELIAKLSGIREVINKTPDVDAPSAINTIAAGEGDVGLASTGVVRAHWEAGRVDVILSTLNYIPAPWDTDPNIVTAEQAGLGNLGIGNYRGWVVTKATPREHVDWLNKLFKAGAATEEYKKRETSVPGTRLMAMTPEEANDLARKLASEMDPVVRSVNLHWEQQK